MSVGSAITFSAYLLGLCIFAQAAVERGVATRALAWIALGGVAAGVLGARLVEWGVGGGTSLAAFLDPRSGGRTLVGGILVGWLAVEGLKRLHGVHRSTGDSFALALAGGEALGRVGCFLNACCHGVVSSVPWAVFQHEAWRHPAQLYSAAFALAVFAVLWGMRENVLREGDLFRWYLVLYGSGRFFIEFTRERTVGTLGLSLAQWVCLGMVGVGLVWMRRVLRKAAACAA